MANGGEVSKERLNSNQDEVILQLESELMELRNACAWKDQRIAELSRTDTPAGRLKRDIRLLAAELHQTRKQLSETLVETQDLQAQLGRSETGRDSSAVPLARDLVDSPSADAIASGSSASRGGASGASRDSERSLRESVGQLQEENRQLKETVARLQTAAPPQHEPGLLHTRQASSSSSQRASEPPQGHLGGLVAGGYRSSDPGPFPPRGGYLAQGAAAGGTAPAAPALHEEQVVYSTVHTENTATLGPQTLQGIGTADGVASVAKVLLSRIQSSVCSHRRPVPAAMQGPTGQPLQPGQIPMVMMGMPQGMP